MADRQQNPGILKHIKHLENQNHKLRRLLISTLDVADQNVASASLLQEETKSLEGTVCDLERTKNDLETLLATALMSDEENIKLTLLKLESEHIQLRSKLDETGKKINNNNEEIHMSQSEDTELENTILELQATKQSLQERIKLIEGKESILTAISSKLKAQLSEIEEKEAQMQYGKIEDSEKKIAVDDKSKNQQDTDSLLAKEKEILIAFPQIQTALTEETKYSHLDKKIIELEKAKMKLYNDLEETIQNSSNEIDAIRSELSDPEIKKLIHEIDIQKTVLMYNLKLAKLQDETTIPKISSAPNFPVTEELPPNPNTSMSYNEKQEGDSRETKMENLTKSLEMKIADLTKNLNNDWYINSEKRNETKSKNTQEELDQIVSKLENERSNLLQQLHSVSANSAQQFLQTQSELHGTFMREVSSETFIESNKFDDATNELYATEEARLEQRIKELEADNDRIKMELNNIIMEIEKDRSVLQPEMPELLKQGIAKLENDTIQVDNK